MRNHLLPPTASRLLLGAAICIGPWSAWAEPEVPAEAPAAQPEAPAPPREPRMLDRHDTDNDGRLSLDEALVMPRMDAARFNELDHNHDGFLDRTETPRGEGRGQGQGPRADRGPQDGPGASFGPGPRMDRGPGPQGPPPPMRFEDLDKDGNGSLSKEEASVMLRPPRPLYADGRGPQAGRDGYGRRGPGQGFDGPRGPRPDFGGPRDQQFGPPPRGGASEDFGRPGPPPRGAERGWEGRGGGYGFQDGQGRGPCRQNEDGPSGPPPPPPPDLDR